MTHDYKKKSNSSPKTLTSEYIHTYMCPWSTEAVMSSTGIFVVIDNNTLYGSKLYIFILCQKSLDIKIMLHEDIL